MNSESIDGHLVISLALNQLKIHGPILYRDPAELL